MAGGLWIGGMTPHEVRIPKSTQREDLVLRAKVKDLEHHMARLSLLNQALWELIRERAHLTDADLEEKAREIDLRDGVEDGKITGTPVRCPSCGRVSNSKHYRCMYCGLEFEKPVMG
ncbi:MAG TPA: hypothetical protein ENN80_10015 [Candidatus Hydrogenedentes bacterium]|nr:hypothetical protein [Candidatus Hydrogenedentota bacterium]